MRNATEERLRAARLAMLAGTGAMVGTAFGQDAAPATEVTKDKAVELDKVSVTGSRIRRVDTETASPVFVIDRSTIERTGVTTVGQLVQELPSISGAATNPRVNNGGGSGASTASLRGLGEQRTLVLLNGRRMIPFRNTNIEGVDLNAIPINLIERVEILKEGASAIYGSDAIGGVVNFITRKDFSGIEAAYEYGISGEDDGERQAVELSFGQNTDKSNIMFGLNWNNQKSVSAGDRKFSKQALYLYGGVVTPGGSARTPTGFIDLPDDYLKDHYNEGGKKGCPTLGRVTRIDGAAGDSPDDFRCFLLSDLYNYQPFNLLLTPQERINAFTVSSFKLNDHVEAYIEGFYNNTKSGWQIASLPLDARDDDITVSAANIYNPFGFDFGGSSGENGNIQYRMEALGGRRTGYETNTGQINLGFRGDLPVLTGWRWDVGGSYARSKEDQNTDGYLFAPALQNAVGPSFIDEGGVARCGTPEAPIASCTPLDIFNLPLALTDPAQAAQFDAIAAGYDLVSTRVMRTGTINLNGGLFQMPAGMVQLALGFEYRDQELNNTVDDLVKGIDDETDSFLKCRLQQETCTNETSGKLIAREYYAETFVPLLANKEYVQSLNLILGVRYSDYSEFGDTTNGKIALEYRPMDDLLLRGSYAEVFRAPTITDLFLNVTANAPTFVDPCTNLRKKDLNDPNRPFLSLACENVAPNTHYQADNAQVTGRYLGGESATLVGLDVPDLKPEQGHVWTYGFVFDPHWVKGVSMTVDFWQYTLKDTLEAVDVNTVSDVCVQTGSFCDFIKRFPDGQVNYIDQPIINLGKIKMKGVDIGLKYRTPQTPVGRFLLSTDVTYFDQFTRTPVPGLDQTIDSAGQYSRQDGNFARVRGLTSATWSYNDWDALLVWRYIHGFDLKDADGNPTDLDGDGTPDQIDLHFGSTSYLDLSIGYTVPKFRNVKVQAGVENLTDKDPPLLYQNNVINANTDVETFDTIGRFWYGRVSIKF